MNIAKLPLAERLEQLDSGRTAHPEYIPSLIDGIRFVKIPAYLLDCDEDAERLQKTTGLTNAAMEQWNFQDLATLIDNWYHTDSPSLKSAASDAMDLLAATWVKLFRVIRKYQRKEARP